MTENTSILKETYMISTPKHSIPHISRTTLAMILTGILSVITVFTIIKDTHAGSAKSGLLDSLHRDYPQYFNLPTEDGLTVFVSEPISGEYRCALVAGSNLHPANADLLTFRNNGVDPEAMNAILSTYDISQENIHIQPVIDLLSCYSGGLNTLEGQTDSAVLKQLRDLIIN